MLRSLQRAGKALAGSVKGEACLLGPSSRCGPQEALAEDRKLFSAQSVDRPSTSQPDSGAATSGPSYYKELASKYADPESIPEDVIQRLRNDVFGRAVRLHEPTGRRALARPLQGRQLADWYWLPPSESPGFHNEERE
jgi:hypothetical protein